MEGLSAGLVAKLLGLALAMPGGRAAASGGDPTSRATEASARVLRPIAPSRGPGRDDLLARLESATDAELGPLLVEAFGAFEVELRAWRLERAEALALAMHERARAQWSAITLALLSTRLGKGERAEEVLAEQSRRTGQPAERVELLERRAIAAMGAGRRERARDLLGEALVLGGRDAQQMLGREALARGDHERARLLFAALLPPVGAGKAPYEAGQVPAWALRGWGLALLGTRADPVGPPAKR